jgi:hypothetical protein
VPWLLLGWSCAALLVALLRVPYDDEWYSIELASRATASPRFWQALQSDMHPPWVALFDRSLAQLTAAAPSWRTLALALQVPRIAASALAIACLAAALDKPLRLPRWSFVLAALHPIVLFYAGSARWYPFLLLAHALRAYALWRPERVVAGRLAFVCGAALGSLTSYLDAPFLVHDALWLWFRRERGRRAPVLSMLAAGACVVAARAASALQGGYHALRWPDARFDPLTIAQWLGLGVVGEAGLPWPWLLTGLVAAMSCGVAYLAALRDHAARTPALWVASYGTLWAMACSFGVFHPRYSLLLWIVLAALATRLAHRGRPAARALSALGAAHMLLVLALVVNGHGFYKADLNTLSAADCRVVDAAQGAPLAIAPYPRLAALVESRCNLRAELLTVPSLWMTLDENEQLRQVRERLRDVSTVWLLSTHFESSIALTESRVRELLAQRCVPEPPRAFGKPGHHELRPDRPSDFRRYELQRWTCQSRARDVSSSAWR